MASQRPLMAQYGDSNASSNAEAPIEREERGTSDHVPTEASIKQESQERVSKGMPIGVTTSEIQDTNMGITTNQGDGSAKRLGPFSQDTEFTTKHIMGTNDNCTVSKRSVEKLYYPRPHLYRYFVKKPKKRAPLINRGYWLRLQVIERSLQAFLAQTAGSKRVVLNLGCGYDALPFRMLATKPELCTGAVFVDVDYEPLLLEKTKIVKETEQLRLLLDRLVEPQDQDGFLLKSENYAAISCDLKDLERLDRLIRGTFGSDVSFLVICEVSITYMDHSAANAIVHWAATLGNVRFHLLEQCLPNGPSYPFARTMLNHFSKLHSPLRVVERYPQISDQIQRFREAGWQSISAESLWTLWNESEYFNSAERAKLNTVEDFDEWEEFALFSAHYFLLIAKTKHIPAPSKSRTISAAKVTAPAQVSQHTRSRSEPAVCPPRRYAALYEAEKGVFDFYAGDNGTRRVASTDTFVASQKPSPVRMPERPDATARVHHTITPLSQQFDCLLVGGRDAPTMPLSDCWLRRSGHWRRVEDLPSPLYRHAATSVKDRNGQDGVLVYGGRTSQSELSPAWYLWREQRGWEEVECTSKSIIPRFGANLVSLEARDAGLLLGGMSADGKVLLECYNWHLDTSEVPVRIKIENCLESVKDACLCRFGACLVNSPQGLYLVGGVEPSGLPPSGSEICRLIVSTSTRHEGSRLLGFASLPDWHGGGLDPQPLLVGHSAICDGEGIVVAGGGATCFSFGSFMNSDVWRLSAEGRCERGVWKLARHDVASPEVERSAKRQKLAVLPSNPQSHAHRAHLIPVKKVQVKSHEVFQKKMARGTPCVFESVNMGPCVTKWTTEYLKKAIGGDRQFDVHHAQEDTMLFESKNFVIEKNTFSGFMDAIVLGEKRYLRTISSQDHRKPANFGKDFASLAPDFVLPIEQILPKGRIHSSVLRISGDINMWLHYDVMPNILCQIRGSKRLVLFPPEDVGGLMIPPGRSSSDLNVFDPLVLSSPPLSQTHPYEAILNPGDILFIPAFWCHTAIPLDGISVAINIFFKASDHNYYAAGKDTYGNRDVQEYEYGRRDIGKAVSRFEGMPTEMRRFYLERLGQEILQKAREVE